MNPRQLISTLAIIVTLTPAAALGVIVRDQSSPATATSTATPPPSHIPQSTINAATSQPPQTTPVPSAPPTTPSPSINKYIVRSRPISDNTELLKFKTSLEVLGYKPILHGYTAPSGEQSTVVELGSFNRIDLAVGLMTQLGKYSADFFIVETTTETRTISTGIIDRSAISGILPHHTGSDSTDQIKLVTNAIKSAPSGTLPPNAQRAELPGPPQPTPHFHTGGIIASDTTPQSIIRTKMTTFDTPPEEPPAPAQPLDTTRDSLGYVLTQTAWKMRERGFDVYIEDESFQRPEGILVGYYADREDAMSLASDLVSYDYSVNVVYEASMGSMYYVYADPLGTASEILVIEPGLLNQYSPRDSFTPPSDPLADSLLNFTSKKQ